MTTYCGISKVLDLVHIPVPTTMQFLGTEFWEYVFGTRLHSGVVAVTAGIGNRQAAVDVRAPYGVAQDCFNMIVQQGSPATDAAGILTT